MRTDTIAFLQKAPARLMFSMSNRRLLSIALSIAGSDSGGGAGVQADLKTFAALGVHGVSAITCVTAQNPRGVRGIQEVKPILLRKQIEAVFEELPPGACKSGMLFSSSLIGVVAEFFCAGRRPPLVVDPVMLATSGAPLLQPSAVKRLRRELLPLAALVTPNRDEAELLTGLRVRDEEGLRRAARMLHEQFGCAALVKGGHLRGAREAVDILFDGRTELMLLAPFVRGVSTHGTGCMYSAAITARLARGDSLIEAVTAAKEFITQAIAQSVRAGGHDVLNPFWR
jgi:hydroxymethylpyrimidine kinase/phosphomethylpyrimidine kinase